MATPYVTLTEEANYKFTISISPTDLEHLQSLAGALGIGLSLREYIEHYVPHASIGAQLFRNIMNQIKSRVWEKT